MHTGASKSAGASLVCTVGRRYGPHRRPACGRRWCCGRGTLTRMVGRWSVFVRMEGDGCRACGPYLHPARTRSLVVGWWCGSGCAGGTVVSGIRRGGDWVYRINQDRYSMSKEEPQWKENDADTRATVSTRGGGWSSRRTGTRCLLLGTDLYRRRGRGTRE
ncbi:hypothetical protein B0H16DRAFT_1520335 [Mycena metata]|uniref:Uncharacterized protein n=1 Tax=Mycena metata TaxID=1033252 RepID=A0AAD7JLU1_9AGAR|nr:hypothetical protein B0H16DRAFT_1520335 [Mycena metata]